MGCGEGRVICVSVRGEVFRRVLEGFEVLV